MSLTTKEIDILIKGIETIKTDEVTKHLLRGLLKSSFAKTEEERKTALDDTEKKLAQNMIEKEEFFEDLEIIKAKLIQLKRIAREEEIQSLSR